MALSAGSRLGPYEVLSPLGAGGMGEVYRARDPRLSREVALKVLPEDVAADASRLKRFEKEARSASALNHPNIVAIYDFGSSDSVAYIAMELVEGQTLRDLLSAGALPARNLLPIAAQIAEGLSRAHEAGIVHRDLKPENVVVTKEGLVKILDFGLAKVTDAPADEDGSHLPTETGTEPGTVLGTAAYLSPEQAAGQPVDFRSDQFSLGSIVYEMATGKSAFRGKTAVDTMAAILNEEPEPLALAAPDSPAPLRWVVQRCLSKDPEARYDSTRDLARELRAISAHASDISIAGSASLSAEARRRAVPWKGLALGLVALAAGALLSSPFIGSRSAPAIRFQRVTYQKLNIEAASLSPDGQTIVYTAFVPGSGDGLYAIRPGSREPRSLEFPDSTILSISTLGEIAFARYTDAGIVLTAAPLGGGSSRPLLQGAVRADWSPDGNSLAAVVAREDTVRIEFPLGQKIWEGKRPVGPVRVSPRGNRVVLSRGDELVVVDRKGRPKTLPAEADEFFWSPSGEEIWFTRLHRDSTELRAVTVGGRERFLTSWPGNFVLQGISRSGRLLLESGEERWDVFARFPGDEGVHSYSWLDATIPTSLSADGRTLLFVQKDPGWKSGTTYERPTDGSPAVALGEGYCRAFSPDGKWVVCRDEFTGGGLFLLPTRAGEKKLLPDGGLELRMKDGVDWLPDGSAIVFSGNIPGRRPRIYRQSVSGGPPVPITKEGVVMGFLAKAVSPDGKLVVGAGPGGWSLYPVEGGKPLPIAGRSSEDRIIQWTADGRSLFLYQDAEPNKIWLLDVATGQRRLCKEVALEPPEPASNPGLNAILLTPDGESYVYSWGGWLADLYVLDGLK